jgi:hypothetical protein
VYVDKDGSGLHLLSAPNIHATQMAFYQMPLEYGRDVQQSVVDCILPQVDLFRSGVDAARSAFGIHALVSDVDRNGGDQFAYDGLRISRIASLLKSSGIEELSIDDQIFWLGHLENCKIGGKKKTRKLSYFCVFCTCDCNCE